MKLLYPNDPFQPRRPDEIYLEEYEAAVAAGLKVALFSYEEFLAGTFKSQPRLEQKDLVCYRGWMLTLPDYDRLCFAVRKACAHMLTSPALYELCHYLPSWYPKLAEHTPVTHCFAETDDVTSAVRSLGWTGCFLKDYVKSLATDGGSLVTDLTTIPDVIAKMKKYRGQIEGGLCVREIEDFIPETEQRHFVFRGISYSLQGEAPEIVSIAAKKIDSPFFSVDTVQTIDGRRRIVELGDGQVSDRKAWSAEQFVEILKIG